MGNKIVVFYCHSGQMTTVNTGSIAKYLNKQVSVEEAWTWTWIQHYLRHGDTTILEKLGQYGINQYIVMCILFIFKNILCLF